MPVYFVVMINIPDSADRQPYDEYIKKVKPIVEGFGGRYLCRSEKVMALQPGLKPDRVIIIEFNDKKQLQQCFSSEAYRKIETLRTGTVATNAVIVET